MTKLNNNNITFLWGVGKAKRTGNWWKGYKRHSDTINTRIRLLAALSGEIQKLRQRAVNIALDHHYSVQW